MAGKHVYYRCGACNTRNVYVRTKMLPYGADHYLVARFLICRRCKASKTLIDGADPWRGERVEAAALTLKNRPDPSGRRLAEALGRDMSDDPVIRAESDARERRLQRFKHRWPECRPELSVIGPAENADTDALPDQSDRPEAEEVTIQLTVLFEPGVEVRLAEYVRGVYAKQTFAPGYEREPDLSSLGEIVREGILCALDESNFPGADCIGLITGVVSVE